jgi:iron-sulfur cluster assembly protein
MKLLKEDLLFDITEKAGEMIKDALKDKEPIPLIRVVYNEGGWSGDSLGLVLDESGDNDTIFRVQGITFMVNKDLLERVKPITIDYVDSPMGSRFHISSGLKEEKPCGSCSC